MPYRFGRVVGGIAVLAALWCLLTPAGAAADGGASEGGDGPGVNLESGDSHQSVAVIFNLCPGPGPDACNGIRVRVDQAAGRYLPTQKYSYCTKDESITGFAPKYNGEVVHVSMIAKGGFGTSCAAPVASRNVWTVEAFKDGRLIERGSFWLGQDFGFGTRFYAVCGRDAPLNPAFDNMQCAETAPLTLTLSAPGWQPTYPECPNSSGPYCSLRLHVDATKPCLSAPISSFGSPFGLCVGKSDGSLNWVSPVEDVGKLFFAAFGWVDYQNRKWSAYLMSRGLVHFGVVAGVVPWSGSDSFQVRFALLFPFELEPMTYWASGDSGPPGSPGGPLLFDFESGRVGADVYMQGFLSKRRLPEGTELPPDIPEQVAQLPGLAEGPSDQLRPGLLSLLGGLPGMEE